mmetsp:Transcript_12011/g.19397  ORF Transcript_12011/g.19397 Transcript_12011/m.19397 type:complete len:251 (+) Transcript_12011:1891-2643(+)
MTVSDEAAHVRVSHTQMVSSSEADSKKRPSGDQAHDRTVSVCTRSNSTSFRSIKLHNLIVRSALVVAMSLPSEENCTSHMTSSCALAMLNCSHPSKTFHTCKVQSLPALAIRVPSGEKETQRTLFPFWKAIVILPKLSAWSICISPSHRPRAMRSPYTARERAGASVGSARITARHSPSNSGGGGDADEAEDRRRASRLKKVLESRLPWASMERPGPNLFSVLTAVAQSHSLSVPSSLHVTSRFSSMKRA